jgi:hypothetical protein
MVKGKRPKESQKEPPQESLSAQQSSDVTGSVQTALPMQPAHPFPIGSAPFFGGTPLTILQRSPPKDETKKKLNDEQKGDKGKGKISSQSSQETELDTSTTLPDKKGKKMKIQAKLDTSPKEGISEDGNEEAKLDTSPPPSTDLSHLS